MPTYEYACKDCGEQIEVVQSFTDDALTTCPTCKGSLRKVFGNVGIVFKGSGFYKTDNRSNGSRSTAASSDSGASEKSDTGTSEKSDSSTSTTPPAKESPKKDSSAPAAPASSSTPSTKPAATAAKS